MYECVTKAVRQAPDWRRFIEAVTTQYAPATPPLVEVRIDTDFARRMATELLELDWIDPRVDDRVSQTAYWANVAALWDRLGYDCVRVEFDCRLPHTTRPTRTRPDHTVGQSRCYLNRAEGPITTWEQFRQYPWPTVGEPDLFLFEELERQLPEGMGIMGSHEGGIFEHLVGLMGYEGLSLRLYDQPGLVEAVAERLGDIMTGYYERLLKIPRVVALFPSDDIAYAGSTFLSPEHLRRLVLPWHKQFARLAHEAGRPYFLHSCGAAEEIMPDLLDDVGIDAKHGFLGVEDSPERFKARWGGRIGVMGGTPNALLADGTTDQVRRAVREVIDRCAPGGGFAVGSNFGLTRDLKVENVLAMIDEARR